MAIKMDKTSIIVCSVIGSLGLLSAILGFAAEGTKLTPDTILVLGYSCIYPQNPAIGLGICAAIFLLVAQVTFSAAGGCCGCCKSRSIPSETKRIVGIVCAVFSWIAAVIAIALFIEGAASNVNGVRVVETLYDCKYLKDGIFAGAGVLALAATALAITSFIMQRTQPAAPAPAPAPASSAATTPNNMSGYDGKPPSDYPVKPGYEHPQASIPQGYYAQNVHSSAPPAAQENNNVSHAPNHQLPPRPAPAAAFVAAAAASEPSVLQPALGAVAIDQPLPQVLLPQAQIPSNPIQYPVHIPVPAPQVVGAGGVGFPGVALPVPSAPPPSSAGSASSALSTVIGHEVARQGVKLAAQVVKHSLFSADGNGVLSMMAGSDGGDVVEATN